jgi:hypothetical protein
MAFAHDRRLSVARRSSRGAPRIELSTMSKNLRTNIRNKNIKNKNPSKCVDNQNIEETLM